MRNLKVIIFFTVAMTVVLEGYGQSGIVAGLDYTWLKATVVKGSKYDKNNGMDGWRPKLNYHIGYQWSIPLSSCAGFDFGALFEKAGAKTTPMGLTYDDYTPEDYQKDSVFVIGQVVYPESNYYYLSFPVYFTFCLYGNSLRAGIGGVPSIILSDPLNNEAHNHFDFSMRAKITYSRGRFVFSLGYHHGMLNIFKNVFVEKAYQRGVSLSILYNIKRKP